jgi:hypothetical protein
VVIAYIVSEGPADIFLCINENDGKGPCHKFPIDLVGLVRLNAETAAPLLSLVQRRRFETVQ